MNKLLLVGIFVAVVVSFFLPGLVFEATPHFNGGQSEVMPGTHILMLGWVAPFMGTIAWWANPLIIAALLQAGVGKARSAFLLAFTAFLFGATAILVRTVPRNEGGSNDYVIDHFGSGYYLWMGAIAVLAVLSYLAMRRQPSDVATGSIWPTVGGIVLGVGFYVALVVVTKIGMGSF